LGITTKVTRSLLYIANVGNIPNERTHNVDSEDTDSEDSENTCLHESRGLRALEPNVGANGD